MSFEGRRVRWLGAGGAVLVVFLGVAAAVPARYVELSPGPTFNTIGSYEGTPLITISDHTTYPTTGNLNMTTVSERGGPFGGLYAGRVLQAWFDSNSRVLPQEALYPDDVNTAAVNQQNQVDFVDSQSNAVAAALTHLHIPVTTEVQILSVVAGSPADGKLEPGDVIVSVDGVAIHTIAQVHVQITHRKPGQTVVLTVTRAGVRRIVPVVAGSSPTNPGRAFLGISMSQSYVGPFPITFGLQDVGGPSAGLMFSLGIVDKLTPGSLTRGQFVAGTGTIDPDGNVGPIGGIAQKLAAARAAGATIFLAPSANCPDVVGHIPPGLQVASVTTLEEAVTAVRALTTNHQPPATCH